MSKYIIKNCENLLYCTACKDYECALADEFPYKRKCADTDNCNLKQIVKLCKDICQDCFNVKETNYTPRKDLNNCKTAKILKLLDIQEVE